MKAHSPSSSMLAYVALSSFSVASFPVTEHCFPDRYTMFWVLLLATKLTVSFYIEVKFHFFYLVYCTFICRCFILVSLNMKFVPSLLKNKINLNVRQLGP